MKKIVRRKVARVLMFLILTTVLLVNIRTANVYAQTSDEAGVITDYNSDYYDSCDEFMGDDSAHLL